MFDKKRENSAREAHIQVAKETSNSTWGRVSSDFEKAVPVKEVDRQVFGRSSFNEELEGKSIMREMEKGEFIERHFAHAYIYCLRELELLYAMISNGGTPAWIIDDIESRLKKGLFSGNKNEGSIIRELSIRSVFMSEEIERYKGSSYLQE